MSISPIDLSAAANRVSNSLAAHGAASKQLATKSTSATGQSTATSTSTSSGADISSNDFLTLLVTEMKNQDPTQPTDPNAYIQQLVGVNSLQQLISINQELGTPPGTGSSSSTANVSATPSITNF